MHNLFGSITTCYHCGYAMLYRRISEGLSYLECEKRKQGLICKGSRLRYDLAEASILTYCKGLDVSDILGRDKETKTELSELQHKLQSVEVELTDIEKRYKSILDSIEITENSVLKKDLDNRASELIIQREQIRTEKKETHILIDKLLSNSKNTEEQLKGVKELIDLMRNLTGQERVNLRLNLRTQLRRLISQIRINTVDKQVYVFFQSGESRSLQINPDGSSKILMERIKTN